MVFTPEVAQKGFEFVKVAKFLLFCFVLFFMFFTPIQSAVEQHNGAVFFFGFGEGILFINTKVNCWWSRINQNGI